MSIRFLRKAAPTVSSTECKACGEEGAGLSRKISSETGLYEAGSQQQIGLGRFVLFG